MAKNGAGPCSVQILILDDSTSALSASAEFEIFKQYHQLTKERTAIL
jgi:ABC-type transport system involved in Fe-S cluster assembly fused permease/ATPase subunit